ncbi:MAG: MFS transporter [Cyanobacteria bacterium SBLK]|nr:MFS transporter [Cyanobacteria bacterium SBLK]
MQLFEERERQTPPDDSPPTVAKSADCPPPKPDGDDRSSSERGLLPVLKNPRFLILWFGQIFSQLADKVYIVLMVALVSTHFHVSESHIGTWVSAISIALTIPAILFGSLAGVFVDRWFKKDILVTSNILRGIFVLAIPPLLWFSADWGNLWGVPWGFCLLLLVTFLVSTFTQFFAPAEQVTIPLIVRRDLLIPANSIYATTIMALLIVGFAVGEPLLALADRLLRALVPTWSFGQALLVGSAYTLAGLILLFLKTGEKRESGDREHPHVFQDIWDGILYLRDDRRVRNALIQITSLFCIFAALTILAVPLAAAIPEINAQQFGFLLASGGIGLGLGATILGQWGQHLPRTGLSFWGFIVLALSLVGLSFSDRSLGLALLVMAACGACAATIYVPMQTTIQDQTPEDMRGKVFGLQNNAVNIALSLPLALAGVAQSLWGLRPVLWGLAAVAIATGFLNWYISRPSVLTSSQVKKS